MKHKNSKFSMMLGFEIRVHVISLKSKVLTWYRGMTALILDVMSLA